MKNNTLSFDPRILTPEKMYFGEFEPFRKITLQVVGRYKNAMLGLFSVLNSLACDMTQECLKALWEHRDDVFDAEGKPLYALAKTIICHAVYDFVNGPCRLIRLPKDMVKILKVVSERMETEMESFDSQSFAYEMDEDCADVAIAAEYHNASVVNLDWTPYKEKPDDCENETSDDVDDYCDEMCSDDDLFSLSSSGSEKKRFLLRLLGTLSEEERTLWWDYRVKGMTLEQLGRRYGVSHQAIQGRIKRIEKRLREQHVSQYAELMAA